MQINFQTMYSQLKLWLALTIICMGTVQSRTLINHRLSDGKTVKSAVFKSPAFILGPGEVQNKYYHGINFPRGHIALKGFDAEVVDEKGDSVPLNEVYLHHWLVERFYHKSPLTGEQKKMQNKRFSGEEFLPASNDGVCKNLRQYFGLGSETRHTSTFIPGPYGIVVGDPKTIPEGYQESWLLNVHAIDTRGAENRLGCTECRCDLYNVTRDEFGYPLMDNYVGGLFCCYDETQCQLKKGFQAEKRTLYLKYTVYWVDWDETIVPARVYILDATDTGDNIRHPGDYFTRCQIEYRVPSCTDGTAINECIHTKEAEVVLPRGGYVIYAVAHQHTGGIGAVLYGQDGREICSSIPIYGQGNEAGNEKGYIVGMSTCYPEPGSVKVYSGEKLKFKSLYTKDEGHTGVMGLSYIILADFAENSTISTV